MLQTIGPNIFAKGLILFLRGLSERVLLQRKLAKSAQVAISEFRLLSIPRGHLFVPYLYRAEAAKAPVLGGDGGPARSALRGQAAGRHGGAESYSVA